MNGQTDLLTNIPKESKVFLDSMIFIYTVEKNPIYYNIAYSIIDGMETGKYLGYTSVMSLIETLAKKDLRTNTTKYDYIAAFFANVGNLTVAKIDHEIAYTAAGLRRNYNVSVPDAIQMATAVVNKCDLFITNDAVFKTMQPVRTLILDDIM